MRTLIFIVLILASTVFAANQTDVCRAQCSAYELVWMDDTCFSYIQELCAKDPTNVGLDMIGFWSDMVLKDVSLQTYMEAFICVDLVEDCVVPVNNACRTYCEGNNRGYAPNPYLDSRSVFYNEKDKKLHITVNNGGLAYIDKVYVLTETGSSDAYGVVPKLAKIDNRTLQGMRPSNVRWSPASLKSDQTFTLNYQPTADKYNVVRVTISTDPRFVESSTGDNVYELIINDLPEPAYLEIKSANAERVLPSTTMFKIDTVVKNSGELSGDAKLRYFLGAPLKNQLIYERSISVAAGAEAPDEQYYTFESPNETAIYIQLIKDGKVIGERTLFLEPQFLLVRGTVEDDLGNPLEKAWIETRHESAFFTGPTINLITGTDAKGDYEFYLYLTEEGSYPISASKQGYFGNSTAINFTYNDSGGYFFDNKKVMYLDFTLTQHPVQINPANYPVDGRYIIETDRGRFADEYIRGAGNIPIKGGNGTLFISSKNCSPYTSDFLTRFNGSDMAKSDIRCLSPDKDDEYTILDKEVKLWEKSYDGEEPRMAVFDKRGDHVYVLTANNGDNFCNVYAYDINGNPQYKKAYNSNCIGRSRLVPAYDGSALFIGMNAVKYASAGDTRAQGYRIAGDGAVLDSWLFPEHTESLEFSSATEFLDIVENHEFYLTKNRTIETCMLTPGRTCDPPSGRYAVEQLGISKNRALGTCNNTLCVFTLAYPDYIKLEGVWSDNDAASNYANDDLFVFNYEAGKYFANGTKKWSISEKIDDASMSPGGKYLAVAYDPYGIEILNASGKKLTKKLSARASGLEATERGIFFAKNHGNTLEVYRISTMVEPQSSSTTAQSQGNTSFVGQLFQALADAYNGLISWLKDAFGLG